MIKAFVLDTIGTITFWIPIVAALDFFLLGITVEQLIGVILIGIGINAAFGGLFGKYIDIWRRWLKYRESIDRRG